MPADKAAEAAAAVPPWQSMDTAPKDRFVILWREEDGSRWWAKWQGERWFGVDDLGLNRIGASAGDPDVHTGWFVNAWTPIPERAGRMKEQQP